MLEIIVMLMSLIVGVAVIGRTDDIDIAEGNENANEQRIPTTPKEARNQALLDSRRLLTTGSSRLLALMWSLTPTVAPTTITNRAATTLRRLYEELQDIRKTLNRAGVDTTYYGMLPLRTEPQLRFAAITGRKWAVALCEYYSSQVVCSILNRVADAREICSATTSGIMGKMGLKWDAYAEEGLGGYTEEMLGKKHSGPVAWDWIMEMTTKETWEAAFDFLSDYRGRNHQTTTHNQRQFAETMVTKFAQAEEVAFKEKAAEYGYTE